jgi:hypothetical protein
MKQEVQQPTYQALLIHGLGWRHSAEQEKDLLDKAQAQQAGKAVSVFRYSRPSLEGHFVDSAAQALYKKGIVTDNIVVTGSQLFGHPTPFAEVLENQFRIKSPDANVINAGEARTTAMELNGLAQYAQEQGLDNVASVTLKIHQKRAKKIAKKISKRTGVNITVLAADDILTNPEMHESGEHVSAEAKADRYKEFLGKLKKSKGYRKFVAHELLARNIERTNTTVLFDKLSTWFRPKVMSS